MQRYLEGCEHYTLKPGYIFASERPLVIQTVLGSCISVCLHDRQRSIGGMNHFQMPRTLDAPRTAKFGEPSTQGLIRSLLDFGSRQGDLVAQLYGGASLPEKPLSLEVSNDNILVAREVLAHYRIPILSEDVGGFLGRKLLFMTELNQVLVFKIHKIRAADYYHYSDERRDNFGQPD